MDKTSLGAVSPFYVRPLFLVGANVDGKANFLTIGGGGGVNSEPPMICVPIRHNRYTLKGIRQNNTFSVNVPSVDLVKEADYCGLVSGAEVDKVKVCNFRVFYGKLGTAPLIEQCPINIECRVEHILNLGSHALVIGRIEESYGTTDCLVDGKLDLDKCRPITFTTQQARYMTHGAVIADAYKVGFELKARKA